MRRSLARLVLAAAALVALDGLALARQAPAVPVRLADTGLYSDLPARKRARGVLAYSPQYPLWTDGAAKRRWILLPPGTSIDASDPDRWVFPVGTKLWKEFAFERSVETRYMERRADGEWSFATYAWSVDGREATLAPARGTKGAYTSSDGLRYDLPSQADCRACHESHPTRVLGFGSLQLSSDRDSLAPHAAPLAPDEVDLRELVERGLVRGLPAELSGGAPRIAARTPRERAALGYLHGNCASCHNADGPLGSLGVAFEQRLATTHGAQTPLGTTLDVVGRWRPRGADDACRRIAPGSPQASLVVQRMSARDGVAQMPPFGTRRVDEQALELIAAWIREDLSRSAATTRSAFLQPQATKKE